MEQIPNYVDNKSLDFSSLKPIEIPVKLPGKSPSDPPRILSLREASGAAGTEYEDAKEACFTRAENGRVNSIRGLSRTESLLVSLCLFDGDKPVPLEEVKRLPHWVQTRLFEEAKRISRLEERDTVEVLEKRIKDLQDRLAALKALSNGQTEAKDHPKN